MRVGLVLGAGGIQGGAWLTGGLDALAEETGWDPADGGLRGRHLRRLDDRRAAAPPASRPGSWSPTRAARRSTGVVDADGRPAAEADRAAGAVFQLERTWPPIGPGLVAAGAPHARQPAPLHAGDRRSAAGSRAASSRPRR